MDAGPRKWVAARCVPPQFDCTPGSRLIQIFLRLKVKTHDPFLLISQHHVNELLAVDFSICECLHNLSRLGALAYEG